MSATTQNTTIEGAIAEHIDAAVEALTKAADFSEDGLRAGVFLDIADKRIQLANTELRARGH